MWYLVGIINMIMQTGIVYMKIRINGKNENRRSILECLCFLLFWQQLKSLSFLLNGSLKAGLLCFLL